MFSGKGVQGLKFILHFHSKYRQPNVSKTSTQVHVDGCGFTTRQDVEKDEQITEELPMEPAMDNPDLIEIYRQIMLIDLFQTHFGGWISNLPVYTKVLLALLLLILLAVIAFGFYKLCKSLDKSKKQIDVLINKVKKKMNKLLETFSAYFSQEHEAPTKVKTIKDGTRSHEFHED